MLLLRGKVSSGKAIAYMVAQVTAAQRCCWGQWLRSRHAAKHQLAALYIVHMCCQV